MSGVTQGSVLAGATIIYIDDIPRISISLGSLTLYADDFVLYHPVCGLSDINCCSRTLMQYPCGPVPTTYHSTHPSVNIWSYPENGSHVHAPIPVNNIKINCTDIERVSTLKYLGVWISSDFSWSTHVTNICKNTRRLIGLLYCWFYHYSSQDTLQQLYTSYIRPHLEYAVPAWDPHLQSHIHTMFLYRVLHNSSLYTTAPLLHRNIPVNVRNATLYSLVRPFARTNSYFYSFFSTLYFSLEWSPFCLSKCS